MRNLIETSRQVLINEVTDKEINAVKKLSKDIEKIKKDYFKIAKLGDKTLKDTKFNKKYESILKAQQEILSLIGELTNEKMMQKEEVQLDEKPEPIVEARIPAYKPTKFEGKEFDRKKEIRALKTMHKEIIKIAKIQDNMQYTAETGGTPRIGNPHAIHQGLRSAEQAIFDYMGGIERGHYDGIIDMDRD